MKINRWCREQTAQTSFWKCIVMFYANCSTRASRDSSFKYIPMTSNLGFLAANAEIGENSVMHDAMLWCMSERENSTLSFAVFWGEQILSGCPRGEQRDGLELTKGSRQAVQQQQQQQQTSSSTKRSRAAAQRLLHPPLLLLTAVWTQSCLGLNYVIRTMLQFRILYRALCLCFLHSRIWQILSGHRLCDQACQRRVWIQLQHWHFRLCSLFSLVKVVVVVVVGGQQQMDSSIWCPLIRARATQQQSSPHANTCQSTSLSLLQLG